MVHKGSAEPWVPGMQDLKMDLALDAAQLLGPKARLELRALESGRLLLLVPEEAHHC